VLSPNIIIVIKSSKARWAGHVARPEKQEKGKKVKSNKVIFVMVKCCVFFDVRTELLNTAYMSFGFISI
jgi:hypothetical protein